MTLATLISVLNALLWNTWACHLRQQCIPICSAVAWHRLIPANQKTPSIKRINLVPVKLQVSRSTWQREPGHVHPTPPPYPPRALNWSSTGHQWWEKFYMWIFFISRTIFCQLLVYHLALHKLAGVKDNFEASIISVELVVRVLSKLAIHSLLRKVHLTWRHIPFFAPVPPSRKSCHLSVDRPKPRRQWREFIRFHWSNLWLQGNTITETDNCWRLSLYNFAVCHVTKSSSSPY